MITPTQSLCADIPQILLEALQDYLAKHPDWDRNRVLAAAVSLFLLQNAEGDRRASKVYLETLFRPSTVSPSSLDDHGEGIAAEGLTAEDGISEDRGIGDSVANGSDRKVDSGAIAPPSPSTSAA